MNNQRRKSIARDLKDLKLAYENLIAVKIAEEAAMKQVPMNDEYEDKRRV